MIRIMLVLLMALMGSAIAHAQDFFGYKYANSHILSDKSEGFQRSIIAGSPSDNSIRIEMVFTPSDTTFYLHHFRSKGYNAPVSEGQRMLFKLKSNDIVEISAYCNCDIAKDTTQGVSFASAFFGQKMRMDYSSMCAHYKIPSSIYHKLMAGDVSKIRAEDDMSFTDFRPQGFSKRLLKIYESIEEEIRVRSGDLREGL